MHTIKTQGIVLRGSHFGEADRILTVFTNSLGKIKMMAKGIRKISSHLAGALEPFMLVNLLVYEGKTFYGVTGAVIEKEFPNLHQDLSKTAKAFFLGELVDKFMEERQVSAEIFDLFSSALEEVDSDVPGPLIQAFELKIIEASGFKPELYDCVHCKKRITVGNNSWDNEEGGLICNECNSQFHHGRKVTDSVIKLFRFIHENSSSQIAKLRLDKSIEEEADQILDLYLRSILERELKSQSFMKLIE
ncbi:MAG: DNA repair protein RecO [bacterium]